MKPLPLGEGELTLRLKFDLRNNTSSSDIARKSLREILTGVMTPALFPPPGDQSWEGGLCWRELWADGVEDDTDAAAADDCRREWWWWWFRLFRVGVGPFLCMEYTDVRL